MIFIPVFSPFVLNLIIYYEGETRTDHLNVYLLINNSNYKKNNICYKKQC